MGSDYIEAHSNLLNLIDEYQECEKVADTKKKEDDSEEEVHEESEEKLHQNVKPIFEKLEHNNVIDKNEKGIKGKKKKRAGENSNEKDKNNNNKEKGKMTSKNKIKSVKSS